MPPYEEILRHRMRNGPGECLVGVRRVARIVFFQHDADGSGPGGFVSSQQIFRRGSSTRGDRKVMMKSEEEVVSAL